MASEYSVFFQRQLWPPSLILMVVVSWGEKEIFTKGVSDNFFSATIMAAIFDFNGSGELGRERNFYQGGE